MPFARTAPLRRELETALPQRPFSIVFWDGTRLASNDGGAASTNGRAPTFSLRSPAALAHALRAPGQLGIGRAYVAGELEVDDLDAALEVVDGWKPPALDAKARLRLVAAVARACGLQRPPSRPRAELLPRGRRHSPG